MTVWARTAWALVLAATAWAGGRYTDEQLGARFYYDLGPADVDVAAYPRRQQANYGVFARTCSQCHTLARPINVPLVERKDWKRYVARMHVKTQTRPGTEFSKEEAQAIVDFLAFDAKVRKVEHKADFAAKTTELQALFADVQKERSRRQIEDDQRKAKEAPMGAGERPQP